MITQDSRHRVLGTIVPLLGVLGTLFPLLGCGENAPRDGGLDAMVADASSDDAGPVTLCARDLDCSNSEFCDGEERCMPGTSDASPEGCVPGIAPCAGGETCDEAANTCTRDDCVDEDEDGFDTCSGDCDDSRADINPSTEEQCIPDDPTDEDCNPRTYGFVDIDMDGAADARCFNVDESGMRFSGTDCDDSNSSVSPLAAEACDGRFDENCDGEVDEGCLCSPEGSTRGCGSGLGECAGATETCTATGWSSCSGSPTTELCDGSRDEDCDGSIDEGCGCVTGTTQACGRGACEGSQRCVGGAWDACDGSAPTTELCDGIDTDCDGIGDVSDPDVVGAGDSCGTNTGICVVGTQSCGGVSLTCGGPGYTPMETEICNHLDDDCDGTSDEGVTVAECTRNYPPRTGMVQNYTCYSGAGGSGCFGQLVPATVGTNESGAAYAPWRGDWARIGRFVASVSAEASGLDSHSTLGIIISPVRGAGGATRFTAGLPVLPSGTPAVAAMIYPHTAITSVVVWVHRGSTWTNARFIQTSATSCRVPTVSPTRRTYQFRIDEVAGRPRARVQVGSCYIHGQFSLADWLSDFYGETASYPRFYVGTFAYSADGYLDATMENFEVSRSTSIVNGNACTGC